MMIHMEYYLVVSTIMMFAGIYGFFTRRNTLAILISVELMLNATDINFITHIQPFPFPRRAGRIFLCPCSPSPSRLRKRLSPLPS